MVITVESTKEKLSYDRAFGVMERRISTETEWFSYTAIGTLGLDEFAFKKGHPDYVTIIAFLRSIPLRLFKTIETLCCDMYEGYTQQELKCLKKALSEEEYRLLNGSM